MSDGLNYPQDAAAVRDLIREMLRTQVDHGSSMDGGGGFGSVQLWVSFGGREYVITVKAVVPPPPGDSP